MSHSPDISQHAIALAAAIVLTAVSQVMLRAGAKGKTGLMAAILDPKTLSGYVLFLVVIILAIFAMQKIPLRTVSAFNGITYILVPLMAHWVVKDPLNARMLIGSAMILFGIIIFSL